MELLVRVLLCLLPLTMPTCHLPCNEEDTDILRCPRCPLPCNEEDTNITIRHRVAQTLLRLQLTRAPPPLSRRLEFVQGAAVPNAASVTPPSELYARV